MEEKKSVSRKVILGVWAAILSIIILGTMVVVLFEKNKNTKDASLEENLATDVSDAEHVLTEEELRQVYVQSLTTLRGEVEALSTGETKEKIISTTENRLLSIRVPADKRDEYMNAFLTIDKLAKSEIESTDDVKKKILELLDALVVRE